jgi:molybdopterin-binding protein
MSQITVRVAAEQLGVAYSTLKRWIRDGSVRTTVTEGGHHRLADAEIERLVARTHPDARQKQSAPPDETLVGLSARNRLRGFVEEVRIDGLLAQVRMRVAGQSLTAVVTADAVRALKLRRGDDALAIIKSTEVMIARAAGSDMSGATGTRRTRRRQKQS